MNDEVEGQLNIYNFLKDEDKGTLPITKDPLEDEMKYFFPLLTKIAFSLIFIMLIALPINRIFF